MKKKILAWIFLSTLAVSAQTPQLKFSFNPIALAVGNALNMQIERSFNDGRLGAGLYYVHTGDATRRFDGYSFYGSEESIFMKEYFESLSKPSFWVAEKLSVASGTIFGSSGSATNIGTLGISLQAGYQVVIGNVFLDPFVGYGYAITNDLFGDNQYLGDVHESNFLPQYGLNIGFLF